MKKRYFVWIQIDFEDKNRGEYWYCRDGIWRKDKELEEYKGGHANSCWCNNVRKFRRLMRKWSQYMPKSTRFMLVNRYEEFTVKGIL